MRRRDPQANTGCINWPTNTCQNTGEGGMWAYAIVAPTEDWEDNFVHCYGPTTTINLPMPDVVTNDSGEIYENLPEPDDTYPHAWCHVGKPVLAAICLGTSGGSWHDERTGDYWACTQDDLTDAGRALIDGLSALYGNVTVHITTYLDT